MMWIALTPVIINQRLAETFASEPIGQTVYRQDKTPLKIIGVVSNTSYQEQKA